MLNNSLDYHRGFVDAAMYLMLDTLVCIDEEKELEYAVSAHYGTQFKIEMSWVKEYKLDKFEGNHEVPPDGITKIYDSQELYFNYNEKKRKVIKDILEELEIIESKPNPSEVMIEDDEQDWER